MEEDLSINQCAEILSAVSCSISAEQLSTWANVFAILISKGKSTDQINVIGNFIVGVGGLLLTIAAQKQSCESKQDKLKQLSDLKKQVIELEESLKDK